MVNENELHQDLGTDLGPGLGRLSGATEAAHRRRESGAPPADTPPPKHITEAERREQAKLDAMSPSEKRRMEITRELAAGTLSDADRAERLRELKASLAAEDDEEIKTARANMPLAERRAQYGVEDPKLPKPWLEQYYTEFAGWEAPLYDAAHAHGLEAATVRELRNAAIELGQVVTGTGRPASDEDVMRVLARARVPAAARGDLLSLWRRIEGGGDPA